MLRCVRQMIRKIPLRRNRTPKIPKHSDSKNFLLCVCSLSSQIIPKLQCFSLIPVHLYPTCISCHRFLVLIHFLIQILSTFLKLGVYMYLANSPLQYVLY